MNKSSIKNKILLIFLLTLSVITFFSPKTSHVIAKTPQYAQIKNSNTYLYKSAELTSTKNKWCLIENSYFVKIINNYNSEFYKVEYNGISGFVKKSEINLVNEIPKTPYPNLTTFNTNQTNCYLRSSPQITEITNNVLLTIPKNTQNLKYIGKIIGEEAIDYKGSIWYLTEYNGTYGYIYSAYTNSISPINLNVENVTNYTGEDFSKINPLTNLTCLIIIILTLIPSLFIVIMLYIPKKSYKINNVKPIKNKIKTNFYDENL